MSSIMTWSYVFFSPLCIFIELFTLMKNMNVSSSTLIVLFLPFLFCWLTRAGRLVSLKRIRFLVI